VIARDNPLRAVYDAACKKVGRAAERLEADPAAALALLDEVVADVEARKLDHAERRLLIELRANDPEGPYEFFPFQLRARAMMPFSASSWSMRRPWACLTAAVRLMMRPAP